MPTSDRRRFTRVPFEADTELSLKGHPDCRCELIDLSLKGALVRLPEGSQFEVGDTGSLKVFFEGSDVVIEMSAEVRHCDEETVGIVGSPLDIDSVAHLKRLIELNTGDSSLLNREVAMMHQASLEDDPD